MRGLLTLCFLWLVVITSACMGFDPTSQPPSPLRLDSHQSLLEQRWRVREITLNGELVQFDALEPLSLWVEVSGELFASSLQCPVGLFHIYFEAERHFRLAPGDDVAMACDEFSQSQSSRVADALQATTTYVIQGNQLFLTGRDARIVLDAIPGSADLQTPLILGSNVRLAGHRWRVIEVIFQGEAVEFDAIQPAYVTFEVFGDLVLNTMNCNAGGFHIVAESETRYWLISGATTAQDCGEVGNWQYGRLSQAIGSTTGYEMQDEQVVLTGEDVRIVLEIDSDRP